MLPTIERPAGKRDVLPDVLGQNRDAAGAFVEERHQLFGCRHLEGVFIDDPVAFHCLIDDRAIGEAGIRIERGIEAEFHIVGGEIDAVVPFRLLVEVKGVGQAVVETSHVSAKPGTGRPSSGLTPISDSKIEPVINKVVVSLANMPFTVLMSPVSDQEDRAALLRGVRHRAGGEELAVELLARRRFEQRGRSGAGDGGPARVGH